MMAKATSTVPKIGDVAAMRYEKSGLDHFAYVEAVGTGYILISETNYHKGKFGYRFIPTTYPHLVGFFDPAVVE